MTTGASGSLFGRDPAEADEAPWDPFGTAAVRDRVLAGWRAAAVRFREDANAEEDLALGGYRDRLVVELAQNAADAADRAGVPGRLLLRLTELDDGPVLVAANTGAPLDAAGVEALATLRASAKRDEGTVGRFGVGFAAVLGVCDEPAVLSRHGGVRFSAGDTRALVTAAADDVPALAEELARRDGHVPVLRLPFPAAGAAPAGYDTAVVLPLRGAVAEDLVARLLADVSDALLLALPGLSEVVVERPGEPARTLADVAGRWHVVRREGRFDAALLADRPTEERTRTSWSVTWAVPRAATASPAATLSSATVPPPAANPTTVPPAAVSQAALAQAALAPATLARTALAPAAAGAASAAWPAVVHAPTPSDEPLPWPALLVATFPLDPARRHVAPGPATDALVAEAAAAYADLLAARAADGATPWDLVPVGLPAGRLDGALREAVLRRLPGTAFLVAAEDPSVVLRPRDALALDPPAGGDADVVAALAPAVAGLVLVPRAARPAADLAGVGRTALADVVDQLPPSPDPTVWRERYTALAGLAADPAGREALAALPVPLADGRVVRGARGVVLPGGPPPVAAALAVLGTRAVHPDAAHPLLERLGAVPASPRAALELPEVRAAVAAALDDDADLLGPLSDSLRGDSLRGHSLRGDSLPGDSLPDDFLPGDPGNQAADVADAVLAVAAAAVADGALGPGDLPWLGGVLLPDEDGEPAPARDLVLPGSTAAALLDPDEVGVVDPAVVETWGREVLVAVGVLEGPAVVRADEVPIDAVDAAGAPSDDPDDPDAGPAARLDGWSAWCAEVLDRVEAEVPGGASGGPRLAELVAVADLDVVDPGRWAAFLEVLVADPVLRRAVVEPATVLVGSAAGARAVRVPSYTAWWLREELGGATPWADPDGDAVVRALLPGAPSALGDLPDVDVRAALGAVRSLDELDGEALGVVLDRLADPHLDLDAPTLLGVWTVLADLAEASAAPPDVDPPALVRVLDGASTRLVPAGRAAVVGAPQHLQPGLLEAAGVDGAVVCPGTTARQEALADLLDVPLAADVVDGTVAEDGAAAGERAPVPDGVRRLLAGAARPVPGTWCEHEVLEVGGVEVDWWLDDDGVHACTVDGLAAGLAAVCGAWSRRASVAAVLADPGEVGLCLADDAFG